MFRNDRSLHETSRKLRKKEPALLETTVESLLARGRPISVLEVGFGQGRTLLELAARFRDAAVHFHGVDKTREPPVERREDLLLTARHFGVADEEMLAVLRLPEIFFYDARSLHFPSESMDLVYSAVTVRHMEHKAEFLEEVCRVLAPGGLALLHIGESDWNYPHGSASPPPRLTEHRSRFVLRYRDELIPLPAYLRLFESEALSFEWIERNRCVLKLTKHAPASLDLELAYDAELSIPMRQLGFRKTKGGIKGGFRSVYCVSEARYHSLFERGILTRSEAP